jgi:hypothetical protein
VWGHCSFDEELITPAEVFCRVRLWLADLFSEFDPAYFVYEPMWLNPHLIAANRRLMGLEGVALGLAQERHAKIRDYSIKSVAQFHGTAGLKSSEKKRITRESIEQRYGWSPVTSDEADALALWLFAEAQLDPRSRRSVGPLFSPKRVSC